MTEKFHNTDVLLLCEGTYPFVRGGVSAWVHDIVSGMPETSFRIIFIGGESKTYPKARYLPPPNVLGVDSFFIMEQQAVLMNPCSTPPTMQGFDDLKQFGEHLARGTPLDPAVPRRMALHLGLPGYMTRHDYLSSQLAWNTLVECYRAFCPGTSFLDYYWTLRIMYEPLFRLAAIARQTPPAKVIHAVSTGYAGMLGYMLKLVHGAPLVITEHGIYTKERRLDLVQAEWIREDEGAEHIPGGDGSSELSYIRNLWIRFFEGMGRLAYSEADPIIALMETNRLRQVRDGAPAERTRVIANGIRTQRFAKLRAARTASPPPVAALVGRVVSIKDIKTFIRAIRTVVDHMPSAQGWIVGPQEEDKEYAEQCKQLAAVLGLEENIKFIDYAKMELILPEIGVLVLTSISEGEPLVMLEAFAAGVPVVVTDVGACRDMVEGSTPEDRKLGPCGLLTQIAAPHQTAEAILKILSGGEYYMQLSRAAAQRADIYYNYESMIDAYRKIYLKASENSQWRV